MPTRPLSSPLRFAAAALMATAAAAHAPLIEDHLEAAPYIGALFAAFTVAATVLAFRLVRSDTRATWVASAACCAAAVGAYVFSRVVGLPQITDDIGNWTEPLGLVAIAAESAVVLLATVAVRSPATPNTLRRQSPAIAGGILLALGFAATAAATTAEPPHSHSQQMATLNDAYQQWAQVAGDRFRSSGTTRTYYVSADEVAWDYAPDHRNDITGQPFDSVADTFTKTGPGRIGSTYEKCLYHGYTDSTFRTPQERPAEERYLGILGPVIRAEVGDTIKVVFRNTCAFPASVHPHGVLYAKDGEGAGYDDGTSGADKADDSVAPGHTVTCTWLVPDRAGPGPMDGSSVMWMYHSHVDEIADTNAGLMGPMVVTRRGFARRDGTPKDVDREVFSLFSVMNENLNPYLEANVRQYAEPSEPGESEADGDEFEESNLMHSINGYVFGNQPTITVRKGQRVRWYTMSMGTEVDLHTPHWHGNTVAVNGMWMDTVSLLPAGMVVADMVPDDPGTWLFHCHVNDHIAAGMMTRYTVVN